MKCEMCTREDAKTLDEWKRKDTLVFGIPMSGIVGKWEELGYGLHTKVCEECVIK